MPLHTLCFLIWGNGYPAYHKVLKLGLGMDVLAKSNFHKVIEIAHPHVKAILDRMCERAKQKMKSKDASELGSWKRAVTTSDGCWLIRGFHSQCCTFVVIDFLSGGILYYGHLCMRGSNNVCDSDLWEGTAKSAEGHLAHVCFLKAKNEGMIVEVNWQDQDSSSGNSFRTVFPDGSLSKVMLCGGHVGRSHSNNLKEYKKKKVLDPGFIALHRKAFPEVAKVKCMCEGRAHSKKCGCISDDFLAAAKRNHFSALKQSAQDPNEYARRMRILGKYHSKDVHQWKNKEGEVEGCGFHPDLVCSCGGCGKEEEKGQGLSEGTIQGNKEAGSSADGDEETNASGASGWKASDAEVAEDSTDESEDSSDDDDDLETKCQGKPYTTRHALHCELHALQYEIECERVAQKAKDVIHSEMGRGHSNLPESMFHVLTRFRPKNVNLHQMHYEFSTNCGLCQSNMTFMYHEGPRYHWMKELLELTGLPLPENIEEIWEMENEQRMKTLQKRKTGAAKTARARWKQRRSQESKKRQQLVRRQKIVHTYGEKDYIDEEDILAEVQRKQCKSSRLEVDNAFAAPHGAMVNFGGDGGAAPKKCCCGSSKHQRTSHKDCPLRKK